MERKDIGERIYVIQGREGDAAQLSERSVHVMLSLGLNLERSFFNSYQNNKQHLSFASVRTVFEV